MMIALLLACVDAPAAPDTPVSRAPQGFWDHWGDGRAELAGYRLTQPRYGDARQGKAVLITVTEDFDEKKRVKSDRGGPGTHPVLKLNEVRDFQTGIYDYNVMSSAFLRLDGSDAWGVPTKLAFSSQEWCGHVYDQITTHDDRFERVVHSYFEGEDARVEAPIPAGAIYADTLPLLVRGLVGEPLQPGAQREIQLWPRLIDLRFQHRGGSFTAATLTRSADPSKVEVPAGSFSVDRYTLKAGASTWTWDVDRQAPHVLVRWTGPDGEEAVLTGVERIPYWQKHAEGDEQELSKLFPASGTEGEPADFKR